MIKLQCLKCGREQGHRYADIFIRDGWRAFTDIIWYCPHCAAAENYKIYGKEESAIRLIRRLSKIYNNVRYLPKTIRENEEDE